MRGSRFYGAVAGFDILRLLMGRSDSMTEFFGAHRPATAFDHDSTLVVALELSGKSWQLGAVVPGVSRPPERGLKAGDTAELPKKFRTTRNARLRRHLPTCRPQTKGQGYICAIARHLSSSKKCRRIRSRVSGGAFTLRGSSPCWGDGRHDQARTRRACRKPVCLRHNVVDFPSPEIAKACAQSNSGQEPLQHAASIS